MTNTKHTPTPWKVEEYTGDAQITGGDGNAICIDTAYYPVAPSTEDMHHIVKCVNMHDELVGALRLLLSSSYDYQTGVAEAEETLKKAGAL